ncbi:MAG: hypothetical protein OEW77_12330 [Gemmatimonadota bacterium]|nr:hypothetical protein [Gemmatimonadota bacterium]
MAPQAVVLLDATERKARILQQLAPLFGGALLTVGLALLVIMTGANRLLGALSALAGVALFVWGGRLLVRWEVPYKGHLIRFQNSVVFGERLYIDDDRFDDDADEGAEKVLRGTIAAGDGLGERIVASSAAGILSLRCRIQAESSDGG